MQPTEDHIMAAWFHETRTSIIGTVAAVVFYSAGSELQCSPSSSRVHEPCLLLPAVFRSRPVGDH